MDTVLIRGYELPAEGVGIRLLETPILGEGRPVRWLRAGALGVVISHLRGYAAHRSEEFGDEEGVVSEYLPTAVVEFETVSDDGEHRGTMRRCVFPNERGSAWEVVR